MARPRQTAIVEETNNIEDSYPLSPMQQGMLFHGLSAPHSGVDVEQVVCTLAEELDAPVLRRAWGRVVERHAVLRTGFAWTGHQPQQYVHRRVRLQMDEKDWSGLPENDQRVRLDAFLRAERRRGFEVSLPPLMRLALFRVGEAKHVLAWTFHHLLIDGRSLVTVLNEVFNIYEALCEGRDLELPSPRPYRDYIEWLSGHNCTAAESFWKKQLNGFVTPTPLIIATASKKRHGQHAGHSLKETSLSAAEATRLRSIAKDQKVTVNTLLQGAWAVLLSRYSGEEDILFGAVRACRRSSVGGAESMVGLFINTLPIRVRVPDQLRVLDLLNELRAQSLAMRAHEHTPLVEIQRWSGVPRGQPLFESIISFQDPSWDAVLRAQNGRWSRREFSIHNQPNFPLWMDVYGGVEMKLKIGFDESRFEEADIARMLGHFQTVVRAMVEDMSQRVGDLPLLTDAEQHQLLVEWNATRADYPRDECVHELFEAQVERTPNAVALVHGKEEVSYRELDNHANGVARHLRSLHLEPDTPVGICARRSVEMVAGLMGILKAGAAYVPLDPGYPRDRLAFMLEDSRAPVLLTQTALQSHFEFKISNCKVLLLDARTPEEDRPVTDDSWRVHVSSRNLAYVIYTSGSTGTPKAVELSHRGLVNLLTWHQQAYSVTPADRATQLAGFSFDASVWELWPYLTAGASIHIVDDDTRASAAALVQWLGEEKITISFLPTPLAEAALTLPWPRGAKLRVMLTGGDKLNNRPAAGLPFQLVNHYGPTENTVVSTCAPVAPAGDGSNTTPPIGRPIANVEVFVLDRLLRPVPVGVPGQLFVGGDGLARGYRNNPLLTLEKFITHPFNNQPGARLYKTGDLVRWLPDGNLEFLGRIDHQVKIRGHRIEPGEIETKLNQHPAVRESLVVARETDPGRKQLVAYIIPRHPPGPAFAELSGFLRATLPDYMVPSAFVACGAWPLTPNGKVDRSALPAPDDSNYRASRLFTAPRNHVEENIARIWSEVLGCPRVGAHDNFFELGGHSLLAAQAVSRLKESFNLHMSIRSLFEKPTVAELAREIERTIARSTPRRDPGIARVSREAYRVNRPSPGANAELMKQN
ncbi:MAG TPA: amino acid adenylation domain-containing protein [Candidatus Angelobacter sp.]|nr:amino acid adenylation domain-containing protein [Candidatus Angelobacter sp.]